MSMHLARFAGRIPCIVAVLDLDVERCTKLRALELIPSWYRVQHDLGTVLYHLALAHRAEEIATAVCHHVHVYGLLLLRRTISQGRVCCIQEAWVLVECRGLLLRPLVLVHARLDVPEGHLSVLER